MAAMDNYYKLELLLTTTVNAFRELFFTRWQISQNSDWADSKQFGIQLIQILDKKDYKNFQPIQKKMVDDGDSKSWDLTILSAILCKGKYPGYKTKVDIDNENKAIRAVTTIRNTLAHMATKTLNDADFEAHVIEVKRILEVIGVPDEQIDEMVEDAKKGAVFAERRATILKEEGNELFKEKNYKEACDCYSRAITLSFDLSDDFLGTLYSNRAYAYMNIVTKEMGNEEQKAYYELALEDSLKAMDCRPLWSKPYKRAGDAHRLLNNWTDAIIHYEKCIELEPSRKEESQEHLDICKVMANIRLVASPDDKEGHPITFDERIALWNNDPTADGKMSRRIWFQKEENYKLHGNGLGYAMQGDRFRSGWDVPQDINEAIRCYTRAWKMMNPEGAYRLAWLKYRGIVSQPEPRVGFRIMKDAAEMLIIDEYSAYWVSSAQFALGTIYEKGMGIEVDLKMAAKWYKKSSDNGCERATFFLGELYFYGKGVDKDEEQAIKYWKKAADGGSNNALLRLCRYAPLQKENMKRIIDEKEQEGRISREIAEFCRNLLN